MHGPWPSPFEARALFFPHGPSLRSACGLALAPQGDAICSALADSLVTGVTYNWDFSFLWMYRWLLLKGLGFTILYTVGSIVFGLVIGLLVGLLRLSSSWLVNLPLIAYIEAFRCTPLLVQIIWFYYAFPVLVGVDMPAAVAGMLVLSLYTGAFYAEIFRGGVISIERRQWDAAQAIGVRHLQVF